MTQRVCIRVPATSANMGPGFDCLGMALDIWNTIEVESGSSGFEVSGEGADSLPRDESNLVYKSFRAVFEGMERPVPQVSITCQNEIPLGRGLGSSAAAVAGGLMAANELCGGPLSKERLLELAAKIEGHPDNAAAAIMGCCQIVVQHDEGLITATVPVPEGLKAVLFVPDVPMPTEQARGLLPKQVDRGDAVYNIGRVALLIRALATGDLSHLAVATEDRLHQPARQKIFFPMRNIFRAALSAGALGVFLSGAGSSVLALAQEREFTIGYEMADAAAKSGVNGIIKITQPSKLGAHVIMGARD
jgi:homoserine kinase